MRERQSAHIRRIRGDPALQRPGTDQYYAYFGNKKTHEESLESHDCRIRQVRSEMEWECGGLGGGVKEITLCHQSDLQRSDRDKFVEC